MVTLQLTRALAEKRARMLRRAVVLLEERRRLEGRACGLATAEVQASLRALAELLEGAAESAPLELREGLPFGCGSLRCVPCCAGGCGFEPGTLVQG